MRFPSGKLKHLLPICVLLLVEFVLFFTNWKPGTWLLGWDNMVPELNFPVNFIRSLVGVWQENRGLGLYDGMSHAANLIHTLIIWMMSYAFPSSLLRYIFHISVHAIGGIGMYMLLTHLFEKEEHHSPNGIAVIGAFFYLFNPATIQMFYTPLEAFSVHFASLPWLAYGLLTYVKNGTKKSLLLLLIIFLLSTPQYFVPTLGLAVGILLTAIAVYACFQKEAHASHTERFRRIGTAALGFFIVNLFWIAPFLYGIPQNAPVIAGAKINQMASEETYTRNQQFGDISSVLLQRGYPLNFEDQTTTGMYTYMMAPWRTHFDTPLTLVLSTIVIGLTFFGMFASWNKRHRYLLPFVFLFIVGVLFLGNAIPQLAGIMTAFRERFPFFAEAFRAPFTKFSLLFALSISVLFSGGITVFFKELTRHPKHVSIIAVAVALLGIGWFAFPAFNGNFFYTRLKISPPSDYSELFSYMNTQNPNARIALIPQPSYWSWKYFSYGYRGSGFLWQGLRQPTMDRAFDPWSKTNENYYWELVHALYSKDLQALQGVFSKYDISYILLDEYLQSSGNYRSLYIEESKTLLSQIPSISKVADFGKLTLYKRSNTDSTNFVTVKSGMANVLPVYRWTDHDVAYEQTGDYISASNPHESLHTYTYPFRTLFTKRASQEREFLIHESENLITLESESTATVASVMKSNSEAYNSRKVSDLDPKNAIQCGLIKQGVSSVVKAYDTIEPYLRFLDTNQRSCLSFDVPLVPHNTGYIVAVKHRHQTGRPLMFSLISDTAKHIELETYLSGKTNEWNTQYFILPPLASDGIGYTVYISNDSIGTMPSKNDIQNIRIYTIPYNEMVQSHTSTNSPIGDMNTNATMRVTHPNPALYNVSFQHNITESADQTLVLSQSYDTGWLAFRRTSSFPYFSQIGTHVLVNNWANGWKLDSLQSGNETIDLFFWPQLLEWFGFLLLPVPFLLALRKRTTHS